MLIVPFVFFVLFVVRCVGFCTGHFVMVPLNLTNLHCLQHSFFEHFFNLYYLFAEPDVLFKSAARFQSEMALLDDSTLKNISQPVQQFVLLCTFAGEKCTWYGLILPVT